MNNKELETLVKLKYKFLNPEIDGFYYHTIDELYPKEVVINLQRTFKSVGIVIEDRKEVNRILLKELVKYELKQHE